VSERARSWAAHRFHDLLDAMPDAIVVANENGEIVLVNAHTERLLGYSSGELVGSDVERLVPERHRAAHIRHLSDFLATPATRQMGTQLELCAVCKDGHELPVEISLAPIETDEGTLVVAAIRDVSQRRRLTEQRFRDAWHVASVVEHSEDAILAKTRDGAITDWNRSAERLYGYTAEEIIGRPASLLVPPELANEDEEILRSVFGGEVVEHYETVRVRKDCTRVRVSLSISPIRNPGGTIVAASSIARDITVQKGIEDELRRSNEDLEQFAHAVSHDLSEPLRVIAGFVELLAERFEGQLDEEAERFINFTVSGVERMQAIIDDLLAYSRAGRLPAQPAEVDVTVLVDDVLQGLAASIAEHHTDVEVGQLPKLRAEPTFLRHVFQNLIGNAVKFTEAEQPRVRVSASRERDYWRFDVEDNGPGVEPRHRQRVFEVFQRLHGRATPGTGIGLSIAKRLVERHGGSIWVHPAAEGGSVFSYTIPADGELAHESTDAQADLAGPFESQGGPAGSDPVGRGQPG
jgi:PAS domain S-box-containing protein